MAAISGSQRKRRPSKRALPPREDEKTTASTARAIAELRAFFGMPPVRTAMRRCLKCWQMFPSSGPQNRICRRCSGHFKSGDEAS